MVGFALDAVREIFDLQYFCLASITILYYDHIVTLPTEIERIWRPKLSPISVIFLLNRYLTCFGYIPIMFFFFDSPNVSKPCLEFSRYPGVLCAISQVLIGATLIIRAYALYYRRFWVLGLTVALGASTAGASVWSLLAPADVNLPLRNSSACVPALLTSTLPFQVYWYLSMTFDTVLSILTLWKTYEMYRNYRKAGIHSDLVNLFLRDGSLYFALMAVANMINLILFKRIQTSFFEKSTGNNSVLTHTLSVTVVSRLVLNIRTIGSHDTPEAITTSPQMTTDVHHSSTWIYDMASLIPPDGDRSFGTIETATESTYEMSPASERKRKSTSWKLPELEHS